MKNLRALREEFDNNGGESSIRLVLGSDIANKLFKKNDSKSLAELHPADLRRASNMAKDEAEKLLKKQNDGSSFSDSEQKAFNVLVAMVEMNERQIKLNSETQQEFNLHSRGDKKVFAKGDRCAVVKPYDQEGLSVGSIMRGMAMGANGSAQIQNALSVGVDSSGGYTVPIELLLEFIDRLRDKTVLMQAGAQTVLLNTAKNNMATVINDPVAGWRAESAAVSESDLLFGSVQFQPKSLAVLVKVSRELLEDSINIEMILMNALAQGIATQIDYAGLYGSGANNQPTGLKSILTANNRFSNVGTNGSKLSAVGKWLPIVGAMQKVAAANDQATASIMNCRTKYDLYGLADTTGQPLEAPKIVSDNIQILDTNSVPVNQTVGTATGVCSEIITGNFSNLILGLRQELRIELLRETYANTLQVAFLAHMRADWQCVRPNSFWSTTGILAE